MYPSKAHHLSTLFIKVRISNHIKYKIKQNKTKTSSKSYLNFH